MITLPESAHEVLAERFALLYTKLPDGWVWDPTLVKTPPLKPNDIADFNIRGYHREEDFMVIFCSAMTERITIKILLAYRGDKKEVAIRNAKSAWLRDDLGRNEGDILYGTRCLITVVNCPPPREQPVRRHQRNHLIENTPAVKPAHHGGGRVVQVQENPQWTDWRKKTPPIAQPLKDRLHKLRAITPLVVSSNAAPMTATSTIVIPAATLESPPEAPSPPPAKKRILLVE